MKSIVFFNNKGGVGKTTLICNVAAHFAKQGRKVLLVDCDPQCNSTQLILSDDLCSELYWSEKPSSKETLLDVLGPIESGDASINTSVSPVSGSLNRFGIDVLPGHPRLSLIEDLLGQAWNEATGGVLGGLRKTNWCTAIAKSFSSKYDVIFFDVGPSLGSLNRSVLLGSDFFVAPMGCDIFSIVGIRNIADWLKQWIKFYSTGVSLCDDKFPGQLDRFDIARNVNIAKGFAGYTVQQYITKSKKGVRRPTVAFEKILNQIPAEMTAKMGDFTNLHASAGTPKLGDVPNMFSVIPLAQTAKAPIIDLSGSDGLVGSQFLQAKEYAAIIDGVARALAQNVGI